MTRFLEHRTNPLAVHFALWVAFVLIAAAGIVTVAVPELTEDPPEDAAKKDSDSDTPIPQESASSDR